MDEWAGVRFDDDLVVNGNAKWQYLSTHIPVARASGAGTVPIRSEGYMK